MAYAAWKTNLIADSSDALLEVFVDGELVYSGMMNVPPGEDEWSFDLQPIVKDYVWSKWPHLESPSLSLNISAPGVVVKVAGSEVYSNQFVPDWSYDNAHSLYDLSDPIDGVLDPRMALPYSFISDTSKRVTVNIIYDDGSSSAVYSPYAKAGTFIVDLSNYSGLAGVLISGYRYEVVSTCKRYALVYLNAYGGWDAFVPRGRQIRTDNYTREEFKQLSATLSTARGRTNFDTKVVPSWSLSTGILTDGAASRMHHLLGSPNVYLFDMEEGVYHAVIVKTSSCSYLTAKNNGRQFPTYTIEVELAKDQHRR